MIRLTTLSLCFLLFLSSVARASATTYSNHQENQQAIEPIHSWVNNPDYNNPSSVIDLINILEDIEVISLFSRSQNLPLEKVLLLSSMVSRHEHFDKIFPNCANQTSDVVMAMCTFSYYEWKAQRSMSFSDKENELAVNLFQSGSSEAKRILAYTLVSLEHYSPEVFETILSILNQELSRPQQKNLTFELSLNYLTNMTSTQITTIKNIDAVDHFKHWLQNNKSRLQPSVTHRDENCISYSNNLHRFSLTLPGSFQRIRDIQYTQGTHCFFADNHGRSLTVTTHPFETNLKSTFKAAFDEKNVLSISEIQINNYSAIEYSLKSPSRDHLLGL